MGTVTAAAEISTTLHSFLRLTRKEEHHDSEDVWTVSFLQTGRGGRVRDGDAGSPGPGRHRHRCLHHALQHPPRHDGAGGGGGGDTHVCTGVWMRKSLFTMTSMRR